MYIMSAHVIVYIIYEVNMMYSISQIFGVGKHYFEHVDDVAKMAGETEETGRGSFENK